MSSSIQSLDELNRLIKSSAAITVIFGSETCNVCSTIKGKVKSILSDEFPEIKFFYMDMEQHPMLSGQLSIFTVPTGVVFFNGKECYRFGRNFSANEFRMSIKKVYPLIF